MTDRPMNLFTVDVEEWYHANYDDTRPFPSATSETNLEANVEEILALCDRYHAKGTFFILGSVAEAKPHVVRLIAARGHEIASHGYGHRLVYQQSREAFEADVRKSRDLLQGITGQPVLGYRAPSWSVTKETPWIYPVLKELGFRYDASVFPVKTFLYGIPDAPRFAYRASDGMFEVPTSTVSIAGKNIAFSGGFYFRALPGLAIEAGIRAVNREGHPAVVYLHPREIDPAQPRLELPLKEALIHYVGIRGAARKLEGLLRSHRFTSIADFYRDELASLQLAAERPEA